MLIASPESHHYQKGSNWISSWLVPDLAHAIQQVDKSGTVKASALSSDKTMQ